MYHRYWNRCYTDLIACDPVVDWHDASLFPIHCYGYRNRGCISSLYEPDAGYHSEEIVRSLFVVTGFWHRRCTRILSDPAVLRRGDCLFTVRCSLLQVAYCHRGCTRIRDDPAVLRRGVVTGSLLSSRLYSYPR